MDVIWVMLEGKYFCGGGWTAEPENSPSGKSAPNAELGNPWSPSTATKIIFHLWS
jgi:hypothetical protein